MIMMAAGRKVNRWLIVALLSLFFSGCGSDSGSGLDVNPDGLVDDGPNLSSLELTDLNGVVIKLEDYRGKHEQLDPDKYAVIGVTVDQDPKAVAHFLQEQNIRFRQFADPQMKLAMSELKIRAFPETLIIAADGQLQRRILGARPWQDPDYYLSIFDD
jgi:hypothetical protein